MNNEQLSAVALVLFAVGVGVLVNGLFVLSATFAYIQFGLGALLAIAGVALYAVYAIRVLYASLEVDELPSRSEQRAG